MTAAELAQAIYDDWTSRPDAALGPIPPSQIAHDAILAMCSAVANGIIAGGGGGTTAPTWTKETLGAGVAGATFALAHAPVTGSVFAFVNGWAPDDFTVAGQTLTLGESKAAADVLVVRYQYTETL